MLHKYLTTAKMTFEVVVVDDNSPDGTLAVAQSLQQSYGRELLQIVSRKAKLGLGTAYLDGLQASKGDRIILMDADLSHHPKFISDHGGTNEFHSRSRYCNWDTLRSRRRCSGMGSQAQNSIESCQYPGGFSTAARCLGFDGILSLVRTKGTGDDFTTSHVQGICISNGNRCVGQETGVSYCRSSHYVCRPRVRRIEVRI